MVIQSMMQRITENKLALAKAYKVYSEGACGVSSDSNLTHLGSLRDLLYRHGFSLKKGLGQNFLIDDRILRKIVSAADITSSDGVLEIGPGAGVVTQQLGQAARRVVAVEKDLSLRPVLAESLKDCENVQVQFEDFLQVDLDAVWQSFRDCSQVIVVANLPYYVTTPILFRILESEVPVHRIVVMVQKEVAARLTAQPGSKDYGALTVSVSFRAHVETVAQVHRGAFLPPPGVDSTVVRFNCYDRPPVDVADVTLFRRVVRSAFATRRKTLLNALSGGLSMEKPAVAEILAVIGIDSLRRGETLNLEEFAAITNQLAAAQG